MKIRFCANNPGKGAVLRRLQEEHPEADIAIEKCLGRCHSCAEGPMAVVDGRTVRGTDGDDLYRLVMEAVAAEEDGKKN